MRALIPSLLSAARIVCAPILYLLLIGGYRTAFLTIFALVGVTDMLDGYLARKWHVTSKQGARLDSIGDYVFFGSIPIWIVLAAPQELTRPYLVPMMAMCIVLVLLMLVRAKHGPTYYHLQSAKLASILAYLCGLFVLAGNWVLWPVWIACSMVMIASIEEMALMAGVNRRAP